LREHRAGHAPELLFPRAEFIVGRTAFERALRPHLRDRASFIPELPELLKQSGRLRLIDENSGATSSLGDRMEFRETLGHTPGMLHATVRGERASLFFAADLVPGRAWVHLPITMGYDRFPEQLVNEKAALFADFVTRGVFLFFTHDPEVAAARLVENAGRFKVGQELPTFARWDLDAQSQPE